MTTNTTSIVSPAVSVPAPKVRLPIMVPRKSASIPIPVMPSSGLPIVRRTSASPAVAPALSGIPRVTIARPTLQTIPETVQPQSFEEACEEEMQALRDEELEIRASLPATSNMGLRGKLMNPRIKELVKTFRYMSWNSHGVVRSGRITRRNKNTVSVEAFDAAPGTSSSVGYGLIYDVEPPAPSGPSANDLLKASLASTNYVSWNGKVGPLVGRILRRSEKTMSVLPLGETNPDKYWTVPYTMLKAVSDDQAATLMAAKAYVLSDKFTGASDDE